MSVTNGERLATKQDLADMYQGILPYLGGMPEVLANKFSKGDMYSTDEKMIGQWIDGKPLYQKTIDWGTLPNKEDITKNHNITNIDKIVNVKAIAFNDDGLSLVIPRTYDKEFSPQIAINCSRTYINLFNRGTDYSAFHAYITLQYTKITDSSILIGDDTDYSTDEKIVGTWIDGKPLYQRTVNVGSVSAGTTKTVDFNGIDMVCAFSGVAHSQAYNQQIPIVFGHQNMTNYVVNVLYTENNNKINVYTGDDFSLDWCFITIQYTKITD